MGNKQSANRGSTHSLYQAEEPRETYQFTRSKSMNQYDKPKPQTTNKKPAYNFEIRPTHNTTDDTSSTHSEFRIEKLRNGDATVFEKRGSIASMSSDIRRQKFAATRTNSAQVYSSNPTNSDYKFELFSKSLADFDTQSVSSVRFDEPLVASSRDSGVMSRSSSVKSLSRNNSFSNKPVRLGTGIGVCNLL